MSRPTGGTDGLRAWYDAARWKFQAFERHVEPYLRHTLRSAGADRAQLETRTKGVESFLAKAAAPHPADPSRPKYEDPARQITDFVGARIIVPLSTDVDPVRVVLHRRFTVLEEDDRGAADQLEVPGYQSLHLLVRLGDDALQEPEFKDMDDMVLEIQVRTILQHAWASLQHDLQYKTERPPAPSLSRRLVALAGVLELADREFVQVREQHGLGRPPVGAARPRESERLSAVVLRSLSDALLGEEHGVQAWWDVLAGVVLDLGLATVADFDAACGEWLSKAEDVAAAVRETRPWVANAVVVDQLLRLGLGRDYEERRLAKESSRDPASVRRAATSERNQLLGRLGR